MITLREAKEKLKEIKNRNTDATNIKDKALLAIEGLTFPDITMSPEDKLEKIYMFAHVALGECENPHEDWVEELDKCHKALKLHGII